MKFLLTCTAGLESIAKAEVIKQGGIVQEVKDRLVFFSGEIDLMAKLNLWSRVGNKVYLVLSEEEDIDNFDKLYDLVFFIDWKKYVNKSYPIATKAKSIKSTLASTPAIQKVTKKAIVNKIISKSSSDILLEEKDKPIFEVFLLLIKNKAHVLLNTSGEALHKRGYRCYAGEAPIKESLASALVIFSRWKYFDTFYDIFCGSGTIAIEAAMLAKNIAPGLYRHFSFENRDLLPKGHLEDLKLEAKEKMSNKKYNIIASDIDGNILKIAKMNAKNARVDDAITFILKDFRDYKKEKMKGTLVSNPPYGSRLKNSDIKLMYKDISIILNKNKELQGGIITSYTDFDKLIDLNHYKKRKLYNGNKKCYFYAKKRLKIFTGDF